MKPWNIQNVIPKVDCRFGAPMGRLNIGHQPYTVTSGGNCAIRKKNQIKIYDKPVPLTDGYDAGGAYWGWGNPLRVAYTADLSYIKFYRLTSCSGG